VANNDDRLARLEHKLDELRLQLAAIRGCLYGLSGFILGAALAWSVGWGTTSVWVAVGCGLIVCVLAWVAARTPGRLPQELEEARRQAEQERRERLAGVPGACPKCGATIPPGATHCPRCG
jgi:hypothetical protein